MNDFPRWRNPDVSDEVREEIAESKERAATEFEIMRRNREGMVMAMVRKGTIGHGKGKRKKR